MLHITRKAFYEYNKMKEENNMKKFLAIVLAMLMVLSVCTACSKSGGDNGEITLTWYVPGDKYPDTALVVEE